MAYAWDAGAWDANAWDVGAWGGAASAAVARLSQIIIEVLSPQFHMSYTDVHTALKSLLTEDPALVAWAVGQFGTGSTWHAYDGLPLTELTRENYPAFVFHVGDSNSTAVMDSDMMGDLEAVIVTLQVIAVWCEPSYSDGFAQHLAVPDLVIKAVLGDPILSGAADWVRIDSWAPEVGVEHPIHAIRFVAQIAYQLLG